MRYVCFARAAIPFFLACCPGCHGGAPSAPSARPVETARSTPDTLRGTVRLREGAVFPAGATLRVIARRIDTRVAEQVLEPTGGAWPLTFAVPLTWAKHKGMYSSSLRVYATAELNGSAVMITQEQFADPPLPDGGGKPVELELVPAIE